MVDVFYHLFFFVPVIGQLIFVDATYTWSNWGYKFAIYGGTFGPPNNSHMNLDLKRLWGAKLWSCYPPGN